MLALVASTCAVLAGSSDRRASADTTVNQVYRPSNGVFALTGHGFGHGHGMSQYGAYGAAMQGVGWNDILSFYYPGTVNSTAPPKPNIRVRLMADNAPSSNGTWSLQVQPAQGLAVTDAVGHSGVLAAPAGTSPQLWRAALPPNGSNTDFRAQYLDNTGWHSVVVGGVIGLTGPVSFSAQTPTMTVVYPNGGTRAYLGALRAVYVSGSPPSVAAVNELPLDNYVAGVITSEMPSSWTPGGRLDALAAQAVAARTYGSWRTVNPRSSSYDAVDTTGDQVYGGYSAQTTNGVNAVNLTSRVIRVVSGGSSPIFSQFSSSDGGWTSYGGQTYLPAKQDPYDGIPVNNGSPHTWSLNLSVASIQNAYPQVGSLSQIVVLTRDGNGDWGGRITQMRLDGSAGSVTMSGDAFRGALGLRSNWWAVDQQPVGYLDGSSTTLSSLHVRGWTADPDAPTTPDPVQVYVDVTPFTTLQANLPRPDVAQTFPQYGPNHGYDAVIGNIPEGRHGVCLYAVDLIGSGPGGGPNTLLGCQVVTITHTPFGSLDTVTTATGGVHVGGWVLDPDTAAPDGFTVYVDQTPMLSGIANASRPDVGSAYPGYGNNHGVEADVYVPAGTHAVCLQAQNVGMGSATVVGCKTVTITATGQTGNPFGALDVASRPTASTVRLQGWSIDPDYVLPTDIRVYADSATYLGAQHASASRPDVGAAFPGYGSAHGYDLTVAVPAGARQVCVYAINVGPGNTNTTLGCAQVG